MSSSDFRWEIGCCVFVDSLEDYDQFTSVETAYTLSNASLVLNDDETTNYAVYPYCVKGTLPERNSAGTDQSGSPTLTTEGKRIPGTEVFVGPSTTSAYDGAIYPATVKSISTNTLTLLSSQSQTHIIYPSATFAVGDQVLIRTIPLGWEPNGVFSDYGYMVMPIKRYDQRESLAYLKASTGAVEVESEMAYRMGNQRGVRLVNNSLLANTGQYIKRITPVNSISPRITKYRASWYYRIARAYAGATTTLSGLAAQIKMRALEAGENVLTSIPNPTGTLATYTSGTTATEEWQFDYSTITVNGSGGTTKNWRLLDTNDPGWSTGSLYFVNKLNRFEIQILLSAGTNAAFDVDDIIIEHADGTSGEADGFLSFGWPEMGSVNWTVRRARQRFVTADNELRLPRSYSNTKNKFQLSADFQDMDTQVYQDLQVLLNHQDAGRPLVLRTFHPGLPNVMIGFMDINRFDSRMWDLGKVSFSLSFEEM